MKGLFQKIPKVVLFLATNEKAGRDKLQGILRYVRLHTPWQLHLVENRIGEQQLGDLRAWGETGVIVARMPASIQAVKDGLSFCRQCRNIAEGELCEFCRDPKRDRSKILVIEEPSTLYAIERAGGYRGLYHVLLGVLSPLDGVGPSDIRAEELLDRVKAGGVEEVIVATNPTIEGEATAIYLTRLLKPHHVRVTRIAYGIPVGMDIEYADEVTLVKSIEGRRDL